MNFYAFSGLLNGLAATASGLIVYAKNPRSPKHQAYALYCLAAAIWGYGFCAWQLASSHDLALFFVRLLMVGAIFLPPAYLWHVLTLLDDVESNRWIIRLGWGTSFIYFFANFTSYFVADVHPVGDFLFWPQPGPFFHFYLLGFGLSTIYGTWLLYHGARSRTGPERSRFYLLTIGSVIAYAGGLTTFPLWYGIEIPPNGTILLTVYTRS